MEYSHLGVYSGLVTTAENQETLFTRNLEGIEIPKKAREVLGFCHHPENPIDVQVEIKWEKDGLSGEEISWWVGYGPRTHAWVIKPPGVKSQLPGILALHDHGGYKYYGKEKIAEGPDPINQSLSNWHQSAYGGRAWANELARRGFVVLIPDVFLWGSRKFPLETIQSSVFLGIPNEEQIRKKPDTWDEIAWYNFWAGHHEHLVAKYCNLLGTCLAGVVSHEDRIALNYLQSREDVQANNLGCLGLSGGGNRAVLLRATSELLKAVGIVGLMSSYRALLDRHVACHTWMFFPTNWSRFGDWPDLAGCMAPSPLLVQYDQQDELFTLVGMQEAHEILSARYENAGCPEAYTGEFYPGPHKFDLEMQEAAFNWMRKWLI